MSDPLLFPPDYAEPVDPRSQVTRMPGTAAAPCLCAKPSCSFPWCTFPRPKGER